MGGYTYMTSWGLDYGSHIDKPPTLPRKHVKKPHDPHDDTSRCMIPGIDRPPPLPEKLKPPPIPEKECKKYQGKNPDGFCSIANNPLPKFVRRDIGNAQSSVIFGITHSTSLDSVAMDSISTNPRYTHNSPVHLSGVTNSPVSTVGTQSVPSVLSHKHRCTPCSESVHMPRDQLAQYPDDTYLEPKCADCENSAGLYHEYTDIEASQYPSDTYLKPKCANCENSAGPYCEYTEIDASQYPGDNYLKPKCANCENSAGTYHGYKNVDSFQYPDDSYLEAKCADYDNSAEPYHKYKYINSSQYSYLEPKYVDNETSVGPYHGYKDVDSLVDAICSGTYKP